MSRSFKAAVVLLPGLLLATTLANADDDKLMGTRPTEWQLTGWMNTGPLTLQDLRGKVVLVRWWTGDCKYCAATAPALKEFHSTYSSKVLVVVAVYHHKAKGPLQVGSVKRLVQDFGFAFPVAIDPDWQTLQRWWLPDSGRATTSMRF